MAEAVPRSAAISAVFAATAIVAVSLLAAQFKPTHLVADEKPPIDLAHQIPSSFADWHVDESVAPVVPSPDVMARLNAAYDQLLTRTYADAEGHRVMLSVAYGADQSSDASQVHRPEFCYVSQGFQLRAIGESRLAVGGRELRTRRLVATIGNRVEPITYWIVMDDTQMLPGFSRQLARLKAGLRGRISDGLLFRISTLGPGDQEAFGVQDGFVRELYDAMTPSVRSPYFGRS